MEESFSTMHAIFVSDIHRGHGHVFGMRFASFAEVLARRGHRIIYLSPTKSASDDGDTPDGLRLRLATHDWAQPMHVAVQGRPHAPTELLRSGRLPSPLRRALTAGLMLGRGGVHSEFPDGAAPLIPILADEFKPHAVWAVFGNTSSLVLGQTIARRAGTGWVMDLKDNWQSYVPPGLRWAMARRFRDATSFTTNAELHAAAATPWVTQRHRVVYSGMAPEMIAAADSRPRGDEFQIMLMGSIYYDDRMLAFLAAINAWLQRLPPEQRLRVTFRYAGNAAAQVAALLTREPLACVTMATPNVPLAELGPLCQASAVNCYIWNTTTFHHKMLELCACRRPIIAFPGEHAESIAIAKAVGGGLNPCADTADVVAALDRIYADWASGRGFIAETRLDSVGWDAMAAKLEAALLEAAAAKRS